MAKRTLLAGIVVLLAGVSTVNSALMELEFSGAVNWVVTAEELRGQLPVEGVVAVGDSISGILRYDTLAVDRDPGDDRGTYIYSTAPNGISVTVNEHVFVSDPESLNFKVSVINADNHKIPHHAWYASSLSNLSILDGYAAITNILFAAGASPYKLMDDSLLTTERELSGWQMQLYIGGVGNDDKVLSFRGDIDSLSVVPEPATIGFLAAGGLMLLAKRKPRSFVED